MNREDIVAPGDGRGNVTIVCLTSGNLELKIDLSFTWSAEKDKQLLGLYWCKSLECSHIFTADPRGMLKLWNVRNAFFSNTHAITTSQEVPLVAMFESSFGARIMCLDASLQEETGGDGCICFFRYGRNVQKIEFVGMRQIKELGTIQSIYANHATENQLLGTFAIGFTSLQILSFGTLKMIQRWFKYHVEDGGALVLVILGQSLSIRIVLP